MAVHLDYTLMAEIAMNRDLGLQLGVRTWLLHAFLVHNLHRVDLLCLAVRALVALCKAALSKKLSFDIPEGSVRRERANFTRLVLGCIKAKFCN